ncbi:helix-turn-helix domain-containing protein [Enterobacter roggenkampii]|uniref:helix-turn-helix domain-containing protein n=1 Tax=Enterobacter roggenkampii TaxID=1812935 RepID=UPI001C70A666|nr:helix-turn-helix domain-containing protein [Enterobacter roggenkampii]MBW9467660.1 helix-turn-helix domain-containing protein [Enterobacter roggenkampii]
MEKTNQFLMVDYEILKINTITHNGKEFKFTDTLKNTYCYILGWGEGKAFPSYNKIADVFGITKGSAQDRINKLIEMGLVEKIERRDGKQRFSNLYNVLPINQESTTGRSYSENIGTRHQQPTHFKKEIGESSKNCIEEPESLENDFDSFAYDPAQDDDSDSSTSCADELDRDVYRSSPIEDTLTQKVAPPVAAEKKIYPWGTIPYATNGEYNADAWAWGVKNSDGTDEGALRAIAKYTGDEIDFSRVPGSHLFLIDEDSKIPF